MDTAPRKAGRPRKDASDLRVERVQVKMTRAEMAKLRSNAQYAQRSVARYMRESAIAACVIDPPKEQAS